MRNAASTFGTTTRGHLNKAAEQYERIVALLDPAITGKGGDHYKVFMGDLAKQKAHVKTVLEPVKEAFLQAADEMEKALAAEGIDVAATSAVEEG